MTFHELATVFNELPEQIQANLKEVAKDIGEGLERRVKSKLGTYQPGWPELAGSTQMKRFMRGNPPNDPLLEQGDYRGSIHNQVRASRGQLDIFVGSNAIQGRTLELGRGAVPPRPHFAPALVEAVDDIQRKVGIAVGDAFEKSAKL